MVNSPDAVRVAEPLLARRVAVVAASSSILVGVTAFAGWFSGVEALTRCGLPGPPVVPQAAASFILIGAAMLLMLHGRYGALAATLAAIVSVCGGLTLAEYLFAVDIGGWDALLTPAPRMDQTPHPGRMAATTATAFVVLGAAVILLRQGRIAVIVAQWLAVTAAAVMATMLLGSAYGAHPFFQKPPFTPLAHATAVAMVVCTIGILSLRPLEGWLAIVTARGVGGRVARIFLSMSAIVPALFGGIVLAIGATRRDEPFAIAVLACSMALALVVASLWSSSRLHRATVAAEESDRLYRSLFNANIVGVARWNLQGDYINVNDAFLEIIGRSRADATAPVTRRDVTAPESREADERAIAQLRATGRCDVYLKEFIRADGTRRVVLAAGSLLSGAEAEGIGVYVDVTARVKAEEELRNANEILQKRLDDLFGTTGGSQTVQALAGRLADANAELESFAYSVSHDLRAPLRSIDGFANELLLGYAANLDSRGQHYLARIRAAAGRMSDLIDALLQLSRIGRATLKMQPVNLSDLAARVAADVAEYSPSIAFDIAPNLQVAGDLMLLRVALDNLLRNAAKFSAIRSRPVVEVGAMEEDGRTVYFVRDNGVGFDMQYADRLFSPFQRLHSATDFPGTGVGLAIVSRVVQRHGGRVWASAAPEQGATFFFTLGDPRDAHPAG